MDLFILKKIITHFILPPGFFIAVLVLLFAVFSIRKRYRAGLISLAAALVVWFVAMPVTGDLLLSPLEKRYPVPSTPRGDAIILLGGGASSGVPDITGTGVPSGESMVRLVTAVRLYRLLRVPIILSGGKVYEKIDAESVIMSRFLRDLGVPGTMIIEENRSRDTLENSLLTAQVCSQKKFSKPVLVTSSFHMPRAVYLFNKAGLTVLPVPAGRLSTDRKRFWLDYMPVSFLNLSVAMKEYIAIGYYRLFLPGSNDGISEN